VLNKIDMVSFPPTSGLLPNRHESTVMKSPFVDYGMLVSLNTVIVYLSGYALRCLEGGEGWGKI
jgi:hypothetical protein